MSAKQVILGIGGHTADSAACLMVDGQVVAAVEEERFSRNKQQGGWPRRSIEWVLQRAGVSPEEVTHATFCYDLWRRLGRRLPHRLRRFASYPVQNAFLAMNEVRVVAKIQRNLTALRRRGTTVRTVRHHLCHAAGAFFTSPYDEAAVYTVDLMGEWDTTALVQGQGSNLKLLDTTSYPDSLGLFYNAVTRHLGFEAHDEYKVMGLASYGTPRYLKQLRRVIHPDAAGRFRLDTSYLRHHLTGGLMGDSLLSPKFAEEFGPARRKQEPIGEHHKDLAASIQAAFEECVFHQLRHLHRLTGSRNLCIAGGCGLNGAMNGRIYDNTPFEHVFLPSVSGDDGLGLGGACYLRHQVLGHKRTEPLLRADLGPDYSDQEILSMLELFKLDYRRVEDPVPPAVEMLMQGKIVGWFQGRLEFGARALGNRSILANPTMPHMKDEINRCVKFREQFRPFAPSVIEQEAGRYFKIRDPIPFMTVVVPVTEQGKSALPATTHVDDTARVQTVSREHSPLYWRLISEFGKASDTPVVLNTSFNVMGEPIVTTPEQAVRCFYSCGMDALVLGNYVLEKDPSLR